MKSLIKNVLAVIGALALTGMVVACGFHGDPEERAQWMQKKVSKVLELDDAQEQQLQNLGGELQQARKAMKDELAGNGDQLLALVEQPILDQQTLLALVDSHTRLVNELAPGVILAAGEFYDALNGEQQAQIREFMQEHRDSHGRRGRRHHD